MNPKTKQLLDAFCARPFTSLLLLGPAERGTEYCLKYIQETLLDADTRNNLIRIEPQLPKALSVEQIRDLKTSLATKSNRKGNTVTRIVYVSGFHTATVEAQNALLKVLEEPTEATVIILQADERESILQQFNLGAISFLFCHSQKNKFYRKLLHPIVRSMNCKRYCPLAVEMPLLCDKCCQTTRKLIFV